jgi:hypothetical protein
MATVTLGGDRLGSGNKQEVELKNYSRSTHDLSYLWRSTMASGTLVPFMSEVALPGDNFSINLDLDMKTHPTIGPLFGSYKIQVDVFQCPIRLYNGKLHMNLLNIGLNMNQIKLPQVLVTGPNKNISDNSQINPSSLLSYLDIRGIGTDVNTSTDWVSREFNAIPLLCYWDIYKNYYANKQEEIGVYVHNDLTITTNVVDQNNFIMYDGPNQTGGSVAMPLGSNGTTNYFAIGQQGNTTILFTNQNEPDLNAFFLIYITEQGGGDTIEYVLLTDVFNSVIWDPTNSTLVCTQPINPWTGSYRWAGYSYAGETITNAGGTQLKTFPLSNIDDMREAILMATTSPFAFMIDSSTAAPYGPPLTTDTVKYITSLQSTQEGLGVKTYQSDLFNNWISTDWIDGPNGINEITAVDTSGGSFTINTLQLSNKVYEMLNRIAVSGGSYDDWLNAVYTHERARSQENPIYMGGLIKELGFQEVVSNAQAQTDVNTQPLGTLAGRGVLTKKHKGGKVEIRVDEPSYIIGIVSLTPRLDYSQGNKWSNNLKTLDDLHKPQLDQIGYQDLITDQMAWWDTKINQGSVVYQSAGKQPAWLNYMTNVNRTRGNFAIEEGDTTQEGGQMYMTLNRRYEKNKNNRIEDLTTYVDPMKFNNIFADTRIDAQNFWCQIAVNITARRKMSAKLMPNL